ncbi:histone deacetylase complex subunit SAP30/SAP30-like protein [Artemisia annua]|uniref:Histone deacetylase complex subunit SAP30/SAP30-like protein n=1 Tax=Artemisia annua TaxID=35608 RepID=A0A2U1LHY2_ARTAN|nr:histone deacetylase complex subunit SAP30/SAP30-like protein [Artemisia annua]
MMETELYSSKLFSHLRDDSGDEELSLLPRHTKVVVTGNNRTKSVLVGLQGVVKKAVGLGGWHWLVLKNGIEVKLQRNALSVLEPPTGQEEDGEIDFDNSSCGSDAGEKDNLFAAPTEFSKPSKPRVRYTRPWGPSLSTKPMNRSIRKETQSNIYPCYSKVNFTKLGTNTLWRYYSTFNLGNIHTNPSKEHLVTAIQKHFASQRVSELEVIMEFIHAAKRKRFGRAHRDRN